MAKGKARDDGKERQWRRVVEGWRGSGLTVRAYCDVHGLSEASFYAWRRVLTERDAERVEFVPVVVEGERKCSPGVGLELVLGADRTVRIPADFDAATLGRLLAVLEEKPC